MKGSLLTGTSRDQFIDQKHIPRCHGRNRRLIHATQGRRRSIGVFRGLRTRLFHVLIPGSGEFCSASISHVNPLRKGPGHSKPGRASHFGTRRLAARLPGKRPKLTLCQSPLFVSKSAVRSFPLAFAVDIIPMNSLRLSRTEDAAPVVGSPVSLPVQHPVSPRKSRSKPSIGWVAQGL